MARFIKLEEVAKSPDGGVIGIVPIYLNADDVTYFAADRVNPETTFVAFTNGHGRTINMNLESFSTYIQ